MNKTKKSKILPVTARGTHISRWHTCLQIYLMVHIMYSMETMPTKMWNGWYQFKIEKRLNQHHEGEQDQF